MFPRQTRRCVPLGAGETYGKNSASSPSGCKWIESTIWYPTVLTFGAVSIAFIGMNDVHDMSLKQQVLYAGCGARYLLAGNFHFPERYELGRKGSQSRRPGGTIIPAGLLIVLGIIYLATGGHSNGLPAAFPDLTNFDNVVLAAKYLPLLCRYGNGRYPREGCKQSVKNYPKAVFIGALITVLIFVLGTFALGVIIPAWDISRHKACW